MFGLHMPELIIVLVVALLIFGPKKLPEMGSAIGKSIKEFRKGVNEISNPKEPEASATKHALEEAQTPISQADLNKLANNSYANEEVSAEQHRND